MIIGQLEIQRCRCAALAFPLTVMITDDTPRRVNLHVGRTVLSFRWLHPYPAAQFRAEIAARAVRAPALRRLRVREQAACDAHNDAAAENARRQRMALEHEISEIGRRAWRAAAGCDEGDDPARDPL